VSGDCPSVSLVIPAYGERIVYKLSASEQAAVAAAKPAFRSLASYFRMKDAMNEGDAQTALAATRDLLRLRSRVVKFALLALALRSAPHLTMRVAHWRARWRRWPQPGAGRCARPGDADVPFSDRHRRRRFQKKHFESTWIIGSSMLRWRRKSSTALRQ
jgi:hypothetical protein